MERQRGELKKERGDLRLHMEFPKEQARALGPVEEAFPGGSWV